MNTKALTEIDYFHIRDKIASYCSTQDAKKILLERVPFTDYKKIDESKNLGRECENFLSATSSYGLKSYESINPFFSIIKTDGMNLSLEQVKVIADFITSVKSIKKSVANASEKIEIPLLVERIQKLPDFSEAEKLIFRIITPDGILRELPEIVAIRKEIASLNAKLKNIMHKIITDPRYQNILESNVPVLKGDRQVLAVKAGLQNKINGIVHEVSQSGKTCFIEPQEAVLCSNSLVQKENELEIIIKKILTELTAALRPSIPFFKEAIPLMAEIDCSMAGAKWGAENKCVYALDCKNEAPLLIKARHPLLGKTVVPIDLRFEKNTNVLIITGPNTGGKTVSLKTFALFSMLNQSGFPVPAAEGSRLPVFDNVFADIGDDQSLEQSLSTFSGHMKNIAGAVNHATSKSLVLLDELGSGTDPQEGSAIAMAVLDELIERKSFVLVTTHLGVLKNYGYTNSSCENASVEFDVSSLSPSYRIIMGLPGESHALDIAQKNGLPQKLCKAAKNFIATEQTDVSALIRGLNRKHVELNKIQKVAEKKENDFLQKKERLDLREENLRKLELNIKKEKMQELDDFLIHSRRQLENLVRTLKEGEITREKTLGVKKFISDLTEDITNLEQKIQREEDNLLQKKKTSHPSSNKKTKKKISNAEALEFARVNDYPHSAFSTGAESENDEQPEVLTYAPGIRVKSLSSGVEGIIISKDKKDSWQVQFGSVKMSVKEKNLEILENQSGGNSGLHSSDSNSDNYDKAYYSTDFSTDEKPVFELRLLGCRAEEAVKLLEHQIDLCVLNNFTSFSVIHGTGEGVLKQVVHDYLSHCPSVKDFSFARAEDGGFGKTYVTMV